ncbi:MAG: c-type cytochrome [Acidimicrobiia bacterium]|nr:c-type cytochrome [Acidimicrobiia bacterium]
MLFASSQASIGAVLLFIAFALAIGYAFINNRNSRAEVGSEIELAPNRKPYLSDEELEGKKLDRTLTLGLIGLFVCAIGLPLYWLNEPSRQNNEVNHFRSTFAERGAALFAPTAEGGFNCAFCHGGMKAEGGEADYTITANGAFVKQVKWKAPALNTVLLRFSRDEVRFIITYGRPFSPMSAWGVKGGGPMNDQQIQNLIDYLQSIQLTPAQSQKQLSEHLAEMRKQKNPDGSLTYPPSMTDGQLLFNMGYDDGFAGGAYSCGRCHTTGWSYHDKTVDGNGAMGPALRNGDTLVRFPGSILGPTNQTDFVCTGSELGKLYGRNGQGSGRMPGFCSVPAAVDDPTNTGEVGVVARDATDPIKVGGQMTHADVQKIVAYERTL